VTEIQTFNPLLYGDGTCRLAGISFPASAMPSGLLFWAFSVRTSPSGKILGIQKPVFNPTAWAKDAGQPLVTWEMKVSPVFYPSRFWESYDWRYGINPGGWKCGINPDDWERGLNPRKSMGPSGNWVWGAENKENIALGTHNLGATTISTKQQSNE
jgi:hypothetical protein